MFEPTNTNRATKPFPLGHDHYDFQSLLLLVICGLGHVAEYAGAGLVGMPAEGLQAPGQVLSSHIPAWWDPGGSGLLRQVPAL